MLVGRGKIPGRGVIGAGEGTITAGQGFLWRLILYLILKYKNIIKKNLRSFS